MIGLSAQYDRYDGEDVASDTDFSSTGWMIGPTMTARVAPDLFFDARLAWGRAANDAERGGVTDAFDGERRLATIALTGLYEAAGYTFLPDVEIAWFDESSDAYTSATLGAVPAAEVSLGQARLGTIIERPVDIGAGLAVVYADLDAVWTRRFEGVLTEGSFAEEIEGFSAEAELGLRISGRGGMTFDAGLGMGGIFADAESYTARLRVNIPIP
jgi:hypothetical protein